MTAQKITATGLIFGLFIMFSSNAAYSLGENPLMRSNPMYTAVNNYNSDMNTISANIESQRIPAGTRFKVRFETPVNSLNSSKGTPFITTILNDIKSDGNIILPAGTTLRGRVGDIQRSRYLSRGASMNLNFDHIVTPTGRQIPVNAHISEFKYLVPQGNLSAGGNYWTVFQDNLNEGVDIVQKATMWGINKGNSAPTKTVLAITVPFGAIGGTFVGSAVFVGKSFSALYKKGQDVKIAPGDIMEIKLNNYIDIPVN